LKYILAEVLLFALQEKICPLAQLLVLLDIVQNTCVVAGCENTIAVKTTPVVD